MAAARPTFKFMNATLPLFVLHLQSPDDALLRDQLRERVGQDPEFFQHTPVVLNLAALAQTDYLPDWSALCAFLRDLGICPVGIMDASELQQRAALAYGLAKFPDRVVRKSAAETIATPALIEPLEAVAPVTTATPGEVQAELALATTPGADDTANRRLTSADLAVSAPAEPAAAPVLIPSVNPERRPAMVIDKPVRTGQRIYAEGTDLIVLAVVSAGAELIADGDIHVYAPLRGRALAGARGNANARIFSQSMEAELVSIAGHFKILEDVPAALMAKPTQVFLDADKVLMQPLGAARST
jgi:septum site-determining protein MinC